MDLSGPVVSKVSLILGGSYSDARGLLRFCNDFNMSEVKRFYTISNSSIQPKRGWIMHQRETKWFFPLRGETILHIEPDRSVVRNVPSVPQSERCVLLADRPAVLCVPPGYWYCIEQNAVAEIQVFSNCFVGEFPNDDFRRPL